MIRDVQALKSCDSVVVKFEASTAKLQSQNQKADELIEIRTKERDLLYEENRLWQERFVNQQAITTDSQKESKRKIRRLKAVVVGQAVLVVLLVI